MDTSMKLSTFLALALLWGLTAGQEEIVVPVRSMEVVQGEEVVLQASYRPGAQLSGNSVIWTYVSNTTETIISYTPGTVSLGNSQFSGRVSFSAPMPSPVLSLSINGTRESDSGRYTVTLIIPSSGNPSSGNILSQEISLNVRVPPAVPECTLSGRPVLKGNVTLGCRSAQGKPPPVYRWQRSSPNPQVFFSPQQNEVSGSLRLVNLSSVMSGKYVCSASNAAGQERCYINLEVMTSKAGVIAGATVGTIVGVIIIILVIIFLLKRRRDSEDELANDIKEDAAAPKRVSWAKSGTGSIASRNGTLSSITSSPHQTHPPPPPAPHDALHPPLQHYPQRPPSSDSASVVTATGSTAGYRPPPRPAGYAHSGTLPLHEHAAANGGGRPQSRTERSTPLPQAQPPPPQRPPMLPVSVVTASNISRMGGVPIMVPAQNQAGSLV